MPDNLENKLINDLNSIFNVKGKLNIKGITNEIKFDIPKDKENELLKYFDEISDKLKINKENYSEIKNIFKTILDELKKNLLSKNFYKIFFKKIRKHFQKKIEEKLFFAINSIIK